MMQLERLFAYDHWANREEVVRFREIAPNAAALRVFNHIIGTQWLWLERLGRGKSKMAIWPELGLDEAERELDPLRDAWRAAVRESNGAIQYRNTKGEQWTSSAEDVMMHVVMHGAYHRGQIATLVRQAGETPAYTDYIQATRAGAV